MSGFANPISFKNVNDKQIDEVQKFIREKSDILKSQFKGDTLNLFGRIYSNCPERFEFLPGERILIKEMAAHVKQIADCGGVNKGIGHFQPEVSIKSISVESKSTANETLPNTRTHFLLNKLLEHAIQNAPRKKGGYRYDNIIKRLSSYCRMIAGSLAYEFLQNNFSHSLPSLVSVNRYVRSANCEIVEGVLRTQELLIYLKERGLPPFVVLSEDLTRIIGRPQYCSSTNQIVGFVLPTNRKNGMPVAYSFPARDADEIYDHFSKKNTIASNLSVTMAQPISDAPAFCLLAYGTDNQFTAMDVNKRWMFILNELKKVGITVLGISTDSDPRYNGAMRKISNLGGVVNKNAKWFGCDINTSIPFCIQDTVHVGTKLRNFLLRTIFSKQIPFGSYFVNWKHLHTLMQKCGKDKHQLTNSILNPDDKQKFDHVLRMCDSKVTKLLTDHVEGSQATVLYLNMLRNIIEAFLQETLTPLQRIQKIWYSLFIIRIWRNFILSHKEYTLKDNFLSSNCYTCVELNAHNLVLLLLYLRKINRPDLFAPCLFESQPCESIFRQFRSFTTTYSTKTNCTVKEAESRISKIQLQNDIMHGTRSQIIYRRLGKKQIITSEETIILPSETEIFSEIEKCQKDAIATAKTMGLITKNPKKNYTCETPLCKPKKEIVKKCVVGNCDDSISRPNFQNIQLKNYAGQLKKEVSEASPYCKIPSDDGQKIIFRKSSLCWLWREECKKLSNDRLQRVKDGVFYVVNPIKKKTKKLNTKKHFLAYPYKNKNKGIKASKWKKMSK